MNRSIQTYALTLALMLITIFTPGGLYAEGLSVYRAQAILKKLNYYPDTVTGSMNPATVKAVVTFQADWNLKTTGKLDDPTCRALLAEDGKITSALEKNKEEKTVTEAQTRLKNLFYYFGPVSGKRADISRSALTDFQAEHGLPATGNLDEKTLALIMSDKAQPKKPREITAKPVPPEPAPPAPKKDEPVKKEPVKDKKESAAPAPVNVPAEAPKTAEKKTSSVKPLLALGMGFMGYHPKSGYDATSYEAQHETLHPEQAVIFKDESFAMTTLTLDVAPVSASLSTSRLGGGDYAADRLDLSWYFNLKKKPFLLDFRYDSVESGADVGGSLVDIETTTFSAEWLYREKPWLAWGLGLSYGNYPTLVSFKSDAQEFRAIAFDEDFKLAALDAVLRWDSLAKDPAPLFKTKHLFPYVAGSFHAGLGRGKVSGDVADRLSADLSHGFSGTIYTLNLRFSPEIGLKYQLHRPGFDLDLTLGYALDFHLPHWSLKSMPTLESDEKVEFYRRTISHGPVIGGNLSF